LLRIQQDSHRFWLREFLLEALDVSSLMSQLGPSNSISFLRYQPLTTSNHLSLPRS
jgi:hypothetical protein